MCKLKMKTNSLVCTSDKISKTTKIAELVYVTEAEIGNFKGKTVTISYRRNYHYVMGVDLDAVCVDAACQIGGISESIRSICVRSYGSTGAIHGENSAISARIRKVRLLAMATLSRL